MNDPVDHAGLVRLDSADYALGSTTKYLLAFEAFHLETFFSQYLLLLLGQLVKIDSDLGAFISSTPSNA